MVARRPYGEGADPGTTRFGYTGQMALQGTGLYYFRARVYAPSLGRFLEPDPIRFAGGLNLYAYVSGDPINFTNPLGLDEEKNGTCPTSAGDMPCTEITVKAKRFRRAPIGGGFGPGSGLTFGDSFGQALGGLLDALQQMVEEMLRMLARKDVLHATCVVSARVLEGNPANIGKEGGFFRRNGQFTGILVRAGTAAIIPRQFTGADAAGPELRKASPFISGVTASGQSFSGVSDTVGNEDVQGNLRRKRGRPVSQLEVQDEIRRQNPGLVIIELIDGGMDRVEGVVLRLPLFFANRFGCPRP